MNCVYTTIPTATRVIVIASAPRGVPPHQRGNEPDGEAEHETLTG
jgi:hypothetical protein